MRNFISHIQSVDQMDIDRASRRRKMNLLFVLVIIAAVSVAVYFTNRIGRVMENYGLAWSTEMSYDLIHLQIQFLRSEERRVGIRDESRREVEHEHNNSNR